MYEHCFQFFTARNVVIVQSVFILSVLAYPFVKTNFSRLRPSSFLNGCIPTTILKVRDIGTANLFRDARFVWYENGKFGNGRFNNRNDRGFERNVEEYANEIDESKIVYEKLNWFMKNFQSINVSIRVGGVVVAKNWKILRGHTWLWDVVAALG